MNEETTIEQDLSNKLCQMRRERDQLQRALEWHIYACSAIDETDVNDESTSVMFREVLHDIRDNARAMLEE